MCFSFQEARRARLVESGPQIEVLVRGPIVAVDAAVLAAAARIHATVERYIGTALTPLYVKTRVLSGLGDGLACAEVCHDALVDLSRKEALKASDDLACGPAVRLPPQILRLTTARRMACSARQLVASTSGAHKKANTAANSRSRWAAKRRAGGRRVEEPPEAREQAPTGHGEAVIGECACRPSVAEREGVGEDRLYAGRPRTARMIRGQRAGPA